MDVMTLAATLTLNTNEFNTNLDASERKMKLLAPGGVALGNIISNGVQKAAKATVQLGKDVIQVGADFDTAMSQVQALGNLGNEDFISIRKRAMELGASTKFTASQVAEAFSYMALAGWKPKEMLEGIDGVLQLAAASGEDLGKTSDIVTDAITAMGMEAKDSGHFVDVLAAASTNSNTTVAQMGQAFKYLATTGGVLHYSIEDVATVLGLLANNGIKAGQAGTSMRQILNTLINPTDKAAEAMNALGISLFDPETNARKPLAQVLREMRDVFKESGLQLEEGFSPEEIQARIDEVNAWYDAEEERLNSLGGTMQQKKARLKDLQDEYAVRLFGAENPNQAFLSKLGDIGGLRGISSLFAIMNSTDEDFAQLTKAVTQSEGQAGKMAETMLNNLQGDITILNSALEGLKIVVSDSFKEDLRSFVQTLTEEIGNLNEVFQQEGVLGLFTNLANWVITGLTDSLSNPSVEQVWQFGEGIGKFIGEVAAKLVTELPSLLSGIVTIGESLAGGLVQGLFKGIFGENTEASSLVKSLESELNNIELNNVKAVGLLNYLEQLASAGDENVTKTDAWIAAVEELEKIMPGVKEELEKQGVSLQDNINRVRTMTDEMRQQAIQQAMVSTLQSQYELLASQGVEKAKQQAQYGIAENQQKAVEDTYRANIGRYSRYISKMIENGSFDGSSEMTEYAKELAQGKYWAGDKYMNLNELTQPELLQIMRELSGFVNNQGGDKVWNFNQDYLSPEEIETLNNQYNQAGTTMEQTTQKIGEIDTQMGNTRDDIALTERAVQAVSEELSGTASGVTEAGASVVDALNGLAKNLPTSSGGEESDGSHAKGLWSVPYDDYVATLHRGEMVLTASQSRRYKQGIDSNYDGLSQMVANAIREGMAGATVNSYLNGHAINSDMSKDTIRQIKSRRFAT